MHLNTKVFSQAYCESETYALVLLSIQEAAMFVHHRIFVTKELCNFHCIDELKNFAANILLKLMCKLRIGIHASNWLVTY